jgi:hypothetical protein
MLLFRHHVIKSLLAAGQISQTTARPGTLSYLAHAPFSIRIET